MQVAITDPDRRSTLLEKSGTQGTAFFQRQPTHQKTMTDAQKPSQKRRWVAGATSFSSLLAHFKMGNAPIQKAIAKPERPFHRTQSRRLKSKRKTKTSTLFQLVARRDWQKVLIRASLFPAEITEKQSFVWYGVEWKSMPLHLACALDPPAAVVEKLLYFHNDTASMTMTKSRITKPKRRFFKHQSLRESNTAQTEELSIASNSMEIPTSTMQEGTCTPLDQFLDDHGMVLQLGLTGHVHAARSRMDWNLDPLLNDADCLLPLHLACLYRSSPAVIHQLCSAYPAGAKCLTMGGMLPIHMMCAGFEMPPPIAVPVDFMMLHDDWRLADALQHLVTAHPESLSVQSRNNGMTPREYIEETMEDGIHKTMCLRALGGDPTETQSFSEETESSVSDEILEHHVPSEILCEDMLSIHGDVEELPEDVKWKAHNQLYSFMLSQDWEGAYDSLEDEPEQAHQWQYGIEIDRLDTREPQLWKRLPIHNACRFGAPQALLSIMLRHNPSCPADPYTGALPIHLACRYAPSMDTVQVMLYTDPTCAKHQDHGGRLPIHFACLQRAPTSVIQVLLKAYPASVTIQDNRGKTPLDYCPAKSIDPDVFKTMQRLQSFLERVELRKKQELRRSESTPQGFIISGDQQDTEHPLTEAETGVA